MESTFEFYFDLIERAMNRIPLLIALHDNVFAQIKAHIEKGTQRDEPGQKRAIFDDALAINESKSALDRSCFSTCFRY